MKLILLCVWAEPAVLGSTKVLYMSSGFWLLGVESRDFSHAEKERTACKPEQIHKTDNPGPFE